MKLNTLLSAAVLTLGALALPAAQHVQEDVVGRWPSIYDGRFKGQVLRAHNWYRGTHCAQRLYWDDELARRAQASVNRCTEHLEHDALGTNLMGVGPAPDNSEAYYYLTWTFATYSWGSEEEKLYDFNKPGFIDRTGHFTQVVWRDSNRIGCAWNVCNNGVPSPARFYCFYNPIGNISPLYEQNVWRDHSCKPFPEFGGLEAAAPSSTAVPISVVEAVAPTPTSDNTVGSKAPDHQDQVFQKVVLEHHNTHRHRHCAENLIWDEDLANQAYITAKECPKDFEHDRAGQNAAVSGPSPLERKVWIDVARDHVDAWYNEETLYNYNNPGFSEGTGHFTQLVWKPSQKVGCAMYDCSSSTDNFPARFICDYDPIGNILNDGEFDKNVRHPTC